MSFIRIFIIYLNSLYKFIIFIIWRSASFVFGACSDTWPETKCLSRAGDNIQPEARYVFKTWCIRWIGNASKFRLCSGKSLEPDAISLMRRLIEINWSLGLGFFGFYWNIYYICKFHLLIQCTYIATPDLKPDIDLKLVVASSKRLGVYSTLVVAFGLKPGVYSRLVMVSGPRPSGYV